MRGVYRAQAPLISEWINSAFVFNLVNGRTYPHRAIYHCLSLFFCFRGGVGLGENGKKPG